MYSIEAIGRRCFVETNEKNARSPLLTVRQVSEWLNVSPSWVRDHATKRRRPALTSMKLGRSLRFREDQLAEWIRQLSEHAPNFAQKNPVRTQPQGEAFDLLHLLNTGHAGTLVTLHANSAGQALARFATCVLQSGIDLSYRAIRSNIAEALNLLVHIERRHGQRLVWEFYAIRRYDPALDRYDLKALYERS
jgi:excisionase family DNA binding protein